MSQDETDDQRQFKIRNFWPLMSVRFKESISQYLQSVPKSIGFDQNLREFFSFKHLKDEISEDQTMRAGKSDQSEFIDITKSGTYGLIFSQNKKTIKIIGIQFDRKWRVNYHTSDVIFRPFGELLEQESNTKHLVLVTLPWVPYLEEMPDLIKKALKSRCQKSFTTVFISIAAFATMNTVIVRKWVRGEKFMEKLRKPHNTLMRLILTSHILRICDVDYIDSMNMLPDPLREEVIKYFEIGNDYKNSSIYRNIRNIATLGWET
ncbi:MAG: hypothetical protein GY749_36235 [Desulfobacteraceae bacterium]|nr:hypothetical protein [Desulfobacteraceae bacterium]